MTVADQFISSSEIKSKRPDSVWVSVRTITRQLLEKSYCPNRKLLLSKRNIKDRLEFCNKYRHWTTDQWRKVMFSDETLIRQFYSYRSRVRRPAMNKSRFSVVKHLWQLMVWGAISGNGLCGLYITPKCKTINSI